MRVDTAPGTCCRIVEVWDDDQMKSRVASGSSLSGWTKSVLRRAARRSGVIARIESLERRAAGGQVTQTLLQQQYRSLIHQGHPLPGLAETEFRVHSQNGEDGILLYLFSILGTATRRCVEICAGDGIQCNTANLITNHGWDGLLVDGDDARIATARAHYKDGRNATWYAPTIAQAWVTAENVNELLTAHGFTGETDLLSIDLNGVDYWVWKAIECVQPRVVAAEFNWTWGPDEAMTVPYDPEFSASVSTDEGINLHMGASLAALTNLGSEKGYRLIGCEQSAVNAFFVRNDLAESLLPKVSPAQCFQLPSLRRAWSPDLLDQLRKYDWVSV